MSTKYNKEELEDLIFNEKLSYREIGRKYGVTDTHIKNVAKKLGINLPVRKVFPEGFKPANKGKVKINYCINCGNQLTLFQKKYCSDKCQHEYRHNSLYKDFLENNDKYCRDYNVRVFKNTFLKDQNHCCAICNLKDEWNNKPLVFVIDHIDGNAYNNKRENIRLICPNCDSQLDTYKSKNKNSARKERYLKNYKNLKT